MHDAKDVVDAAASSMVQLPRPTKIQATFEAKIPHPRKLTSQEVQELRVAILKELGVDRNAD